MNSFRRFKPNQVITFTCSNEGCGHANDRHSRPGIGTGFCLVSGCTCRGGGTFSRPVPPDIVETVPKRGVVSQPAAPRTGEY